MGADCCAAAEIDQTVTAVPETLTDLPEIDFAGIKDPFEKFEQSLPFNRTLLATMQAKIDDAHKACGEQGWVTLSSLHKVLPTKAWAPLADIESKLAKVLLSDEFKDPKANQQPDQIDVGILIMFCLLHCAGKPYDRAVVLYGILQDGGLEAHEEISAGDKDFIPVFNKMAKLVTKDIFNLTKRCGETDFSYSDSDIRKVLDEENLEVIREEQWLDDVYGNQSRLTNERWLEKVSKTANWFFSSNDFRRRIFSNAQVQYKH